MKFVKVSFLVDGDNYINGHNIVADGGLTYLETLK